MLFGSKVIINGGDFRQVGAPADGNCDLIYASDNAQIEITGGTFKAAQPNRTLNCKDDSPNARITVKGGSFYKYNPSEPTLGDTELLLPTDLRLFKTATGMMLLPNNIIL